MENQVILYILGGLLSAIAIVRILLMFTNKKPKK